MKLSILMSTFFILSNGLAQLPKIRRSNDTTDLTFSGTKINPYTREFDSSGQVVFSGYLDT